MKDNKEHFETQNAHGGRNVMPRCLLEGVDIFLKSVERQGESGHDVRVSRFAPWRARVGDLVIMRTALSLFVENSHPETRHQGVMFRSPWAFVDIKSPGAFTPGLRVYYFNFQISLLYSAMVLSDEKKPAFAIL